MAKNGTWQQKGEGGGKETEKEKRKDTKQRRNQNIINKNTAKYIW